MSREMTLSQAAFGPSTLLKQAALVIAGSALIAIAAQIRVPMFPVPMTLQTLAILLVGFTYGSRLGAATVLAYLAEGAAGLPVFTGALPGAVAFVGPTVGFLVGFVGMAWLAGFAAERGLARGVVGTAISAIVISALLYLPGLAWPMALGAPFGIEAGWVGLSFDSALAGFVTPFLVGDVVKALIAALVVSGAWAVMGRKSA
ncbi:biotin transporter BioY [Rhodobacterales bacterium HKCCE2091]|nr:biotin transporter BioY [Rhodobacterales bacterium HKCCE2091]